VKQDVTLIYALQFPVLHVFCVHTFNKGDVVAMVLILRLHFNTQTSNNYV